MDLGESGSWEGFDECEGMGKGKGKGEVEKALGTE